MNGEDLQGLTANAAHKFGFGRQAARRTSAGVARRQLALPGVSMPAGQPVLLRHLKIRWIIVSLTKLSTTSICG